VILQDSITLTTKTTYYVVFVEILNRGGLTQHMHVLLNRFAANTWPTDSI